MSKLTPSEFVKKYSSIAVTEMARTGVPASITLAQGALESAWAGSELTREANNFFGIKAHARATKWEGDVINIDTLEVRSGVTAFEKADFRRYASDEDSFVDHSEFLLSNKRYNSLFDLELVDYKGWAEGLEKAGYATDPEYAEKLISIIEKYKLYKFDEIGAEAFKKKVQTATFNINADPDSDINININISRN